MNPGLQTGCGAQRRSAVVAALCHPGLKLGAILLVGAILRFYSLGNPCLWVDEANTFFIARPPLSSLPLRLANDASPPLYYALLHGWIHVFGSSEWALRSLGAGIGLLLVYAVYRVGRGCFSMSVGLLAALMVAVSPSQIFYAQQVRMYTLLPLLCLLSTYLLVRFLNRPRFGLQVGYVITTTLALYTHNFVVNLLPLHAFLFLCSRPPARQWLLRGCTLILPVLFWLPWYPVFHTQAFGSSPYTWFEELWRGWSLLYPVLATLSSFSPAGGYVTPAVFSILMILGLWAAYRRSEGHAVPGWLWIGSYLWLPILCSLVISHVHFPHYLPGRVDQAVFPAFALLVALGISGIPTRLVRIALCVAILVLGTARAAEEVYRVPGDDREMVRAVSRGLGKNDAVLCTSLSRATVAYYLERDGVTASLYSYPTSTGEHMGGQDDQVLLRDPDHLTEDAGLTLDRIRQSGGGRGRVFIVRVVADVNEPLRAVLAEREGLSLLESYGPFRLSRMRQTAWVDLYGFTGGG